MCNFISWKEIRIKGQEEPEILFLTTNDLLNTKRGKELQAYTTQGDWVGHGAIAFYFEVAAGKGKDEECEDFSSPANFPKVIADAIKAGKLANFPGTHFPRGLLRAALDSEYKAKRATLAADYKAKRDTLDSEYEAKRAPLYSEYKAKRDTLYSEYEAKRAPLDSEYEAKRAPLAADYKAKCATLYADYEAKCDSLAADYKAKCDSLYAECWKLFADVNNRAENWR